MQVRLEGNDLQHEATFMCQSRYIGFFLLYQVFDVEVLNTDYSIICQPN
jgi:NADH:ubiquinone oxidoreductase subunit 3 (subunit A)